MKTPESDVSIAGALNGIALTRHLGTLPRMNAPGEVFNYNTGEANLVGEVLSFGHWYERGTLFGGKNLATFWDGAQCELAARCT